MARTGPPGDEVLSATQAEEEARFRKVEGAMLHVEDAARRLAETAEELRRDKHAPLTSSPPWRLQPEQLAPITSV